MSKYSRWMRSSEWGGWEQEQQGLGEDRGRSTRRENWNWEHLWKDLETQCKGNSQVYMRVTLAKTSSIGEHGLNQSTISGNQEDF